MKYKILITITVTLIFLSACSPKYKLVQQKIPPEITTSSSQCLAQCETQMSTCKNSCQTQHSMCLAEQAEFAKQQYPKQLEIDTAALEAYYAKLSLYESQQRGYDAQSALYLKQAHEYKHLCKTALFNRASHCANAKAANYQYSTLSRPTAPKKPNKTTLEELTISSQEQCNKKCGCEQSYERCFISCGGKIETKRICVSNCD